MNDRITIDDLKSNRRSLLKGMGAAAIGISFASLAGCGGGESAKVGADGKLTATGEAPELNF